MKKSLFDLFLTQQPYHSLSLLDFERSARDKVQYIQAFSVMNDSITRRYVRDPKVSRHRALDPSGRIPKRGIVLENNSVEMDADVCLEIFGTVFQNLQLNERRCS